MTDALRTTATDFKQHVGKYLDAARTRRVVIERQGRPTAVLISVEEYEALNPAASGVIDTLAGEFDALVARMQQRDFHAAMQRAFDATAATRPASPRARRITRRRR